jgi:hypothetical protein
MGEDNAFDRTRRPFMARTLEERIRDIEDRLEIYNLIAAHPPTADTGAKDFTLTMWVEDGVFDRGPDLLGAKGRQAIAEVLVTPGHQAAIAGGIAHVTSLPHVVVEGDSAVATNYLQILVPQTQGDPVDVPNHGVSKGHRAHRVVANRWEFVRTKDGWKIKRRTIHPMDGTEPGRALLREAVTLRAAS